MSLRTRLNLLSTALMVLFLVASGAMMLDNTRKSIREEVRAATKVTVHLLTTVIYSSQFVPHADSQSQVVLNFLNTVGRVRSNEIRYYNNLGDLVYVSPPSTYKAGRYAPQWFSRLVSPQEPPVVLKVSGGILEVIPDPSRATLDAWDDLKGLAWVAALFFVLVNVLVFWVMGRALKPLKTILEGLSHMEQGRLDVRLPDFPLPEMSVISHTFNRMAQALESSMAENRRLALIVQQSGDAIMILDPQGKISFWNPAAERLFGYAPGEILGQPASLLLPEEGRSESGEELAVPLRGGRIDNVETRRVTRDGRVLDVALSAAPLVDPKNGQVIGEIVSLRDITEKKRAEAIARELEQNRRLTQLIQRHVEDERRSLARELHDELGQCATAIKTIGVTIAQRTAERDPEAHTQAKTIVSIAGHLYDLVHNMIRKLRPSALDHLGLPEALQEALDAWRATHPEMEFTLRLEGKLENLGEEVNITVYRIVQECLTNAVKHSGASRVQVHVARGLDAESGEDAVQVTVQDDGRGMGNGNASSRGGYGLLGMRERVQALSGRFWVESRPGEGVRVCAVIPLPAKAKMGAS